MPRKPRKSPVQRSQAVMATICREIAEGRSLRSVCRDEGMPNLATVMRWINEDADFSRAYDVAREMRGDRFGEQVADIAQECYRGELDPNVARVAGALLQWAASRMAPKKYGDRIEQTVKVQDSGAAHLDAVRKLAAQRRAARVIEGNVIRISQDDGDA